MKLFRRSKTKAAYPTQEKAEAAYETSETKAATPEGAVIPPPEMIETAGLDDTTARYELRADADPESDGARYEAIQSERHHLERGD